MTKEEIFLKAIAKAEENGWHQDGFFEDNANVFHFIEWVEDGWPILFYDHDFAAAFWGDPAWEYHLPKMVLSLNPLLYMEDHWPKEV